jgi:hypothetical protein
MRWKRSKIASNSVSGIPGPLSLTVISSDASTARARIATWSDGSV